MGDNKRYARKRITSNPLYVVLKDCIFGDIPCENNL